MSVVIGLVDPALHRSVMVADTCVTSNQWQYEGHKIIKKKLGEEAYLIGASGYLRNFEIASTTDFEYGTNDTDAIVRAWADKVLAACKDKGHGTNNDMETGFLVIFRERLWTIGEDALMHEILANNLFDHPCTAIGCGEDIAMGYLLAGKVEDPVTGAENAVRTACKLNIYCHEPIETLEATP